jgi:hypothetical protein
VYKTANVLTKLPKRQQAKAKRALEEIWMAERLRLAGRALEASAHIDLNRRHIRDRTLPDAALEGVFIEEDRSHHGLSSLLKPPWNIGVAKGHPGGKVHRRNRGCKRTS